MLKVKNKTEYVPCFEKKMNARIVKYLIAYNLIQFGGWIVILLFILFKPLSVFPYLYAFQILALLEILNVRMKWTKSGLFHTIMQVFARIIILLMIHVLASYIHFVRSWISLKDIFIVMITAWAISEVIRYSYYVTQLLKKEIKLITWLRYHAFIICYPVGFICELYLICVLIKFENNISLSSLLVILIIIYLVGFPVLYLHLLKQQKKKIKS
ncbi:MAG: hypothetical protein JWN78_3309 [Bacteroidota bacterium]|nr:hypothetical protein [Bacteroidota bacterium]